MKNKKELFKKANVVSVGTGYKYKNGVRTNEICVVVGVSEKLPLSALRLEDTIPETIDGVKTDVIKLGKIKAQTIDPTVKFRPAVPGSSIGHYSITAGTFGCVVKKNGVDYILSNNHVLANSNDAKLGDEILQPGSYDGGKLTDLVGTLYAYVPIQFEGEETEEPPVEDPNPPIDPPKDNGCFILNIVANTINKIYVLFNRKSRLQVIISHTNLDKIKKYETGNINTVDCALAKPSVDVSRDILQIGQPEGISVAILGEEVQKYGRTSQYTKGEIIQLNATVEIDYDGKIAIFENQIITTAMSQGGDSGSVVLDMNKNIVGLL